MGVREELLSSLRREALLEREKVGLSL